MSSNCIFKDKFEDTKGLIRSRKIDEGETIQWSKEKGGKKQWGTKHFTEIKIGQIEPH